MPIMMEDSENRGAKARARIAVATGIAMRIGTGARGHPGRRNRGIAVRRDRTAAVAGRRREIEIETADHPNRPRLPSCPSR